MRYFQQFRPFSASRSHPLRPEGSFGSAHNTCQVILRLVSVVPLVLLCNFTSSYSFGTKCHYHFLQAAQDRLHNSEISPDIFLATDSLRSFRAVLDAQHIAIAKSKRLQFSLDFVSGALRIPAYTRAFVCIAYRRKFASFRTFATQDRPQAISSRSLLRSSVHALTGWLLVSIRFSRYRPRDTNLAIPM